MNEAESQFAELNIKLKLSQDHFNQCTEYFGESPKTVSPGIFFNIFIKFSRAFKVKNIKF